MNRVWAADSGQGTRAGPGRAQAPVPSRAKYLLPGAAASGSRSVRSSQLAMNCPSLMRWAGWRRSAPVAVAVHQSEVVLPGADHHVGAHRPAVGEVEGVVAEHVVQPDEH